MNNINSASVFLCLVTENISAFFFFFWRGLHFLFLLYGRMFKSSISKALITRKKSVDTGLYWVILCDTNRILKNGYLSICVSPVSSITCLSICLINYLPIFLILDLFYGSLAYLLLPAYHFIPRAVANMMTPKLTAVK